MWIGICDDDVTSIACTRNKIIEYADSIDLRCHITTFTSAADYESMIEMEQNCCDILFLDIELGDDNGISFAKKINHRHPYCQIIFLTNYANYALDAYDAEHCYFVLKDQLLGRLPDIFSRILKRYDFVNHHTILLKENGVSHMVAQKDIYYIERQERYSYIFCRNQHHPFKVRDKFSCLLRNLNAGHFVRSHVSFIVNIFYISDFNRQAIFLHNGKSLPISRSYHKTVIEKIRKWTGEF